MKLIRINTVKANPDDYTVQIEWNDDSTTTSDFSYLVKIEGGGVFRDENFFARATHGNSGRFLMWPGGFVFDADALYAETHFPRHSKPHHGKRLQDLIL